MLEKTPRSVYNFSMSAEYSNSLSQEYITQSFSKILEKIHLNEDLSSPVLSFISDAYQERSKTPTQKGELLQMHRVARFMTQCSTNQVSKEADEFFSGELFAAEFIAQLTGTRNGTGAFANGALMGIMEIDRPGGEHAETRPELDARLAKLAKNTQAWLSNPDEPILPFEYESVLGTLMIEKRMREGEYSADTFIDTTPPKHFAMGFRFVVNEAITSGMLETAQPASEAALQAVELPSRNHDGSPQLETLNGIELPTPEELETLLDNEFGKSDFQLIDAICEKMHRIFSIAIGEVFVPSNASFEEEVSIRRKKTSEIMTVYATKDAGLSEQDIISARGNMFIMTQLEHPEVDDPEKWTSRSYINANHEIRGTFKSVEVIAIPDRYVLREMLKNGSNINPDDEEFQTRYVPSIRLSQPKITQYDDNGAHLGVIEMGDDIDVFIPIVYKDTFICKLSTDGSNPDIE
jgi:hypothetical protein